MNVFGIGTLELLVILLVAFVALGPGKTIEVARTIGRVTREARRTFTDIMDAASLSDNEPSVRRDRPGTNPTARDPAAEDPEAGVPAPESPIQPPSDPLPMPSHLQERSGRPSERMEESERPDEAERREGADSGPPTVQR